VGILALLALALSLANYYTDEQRRLSAAGDARGAIEASRPAVRLDPFDTDALEAQSLAYQQQRKFEEAMASLREATERDPNNYLPYLLLGNLQVSREDLEAAKDSYRDVLRLNPKASVASTYLAQVLIRQGRLEEARQEYLKLEREDRISFEGLYDLGRIEVRTGEADKGLRDLKRARRQARAELDELDGPLLRQRRQFIQSVDLDIADALVVTGRYAQAREILAQSPSEQAPSLLRLLDSDPQAYREQVINSDVY
jgi:tetratricopeptide (TPR) repeat protein